MNTATIIWLVLLGLAVSHTCTAARGDTRVRVIDYVIQGILNYRESRPPRSILSASDYCNTPGAAIDQDGICRSPARLRIDD